MFSSPLQEWGNLYSYIQGNVFALWGIMEMTAQQVNADLIIMANKLEKILYVAALNTLHIYVIYPK